VAAEVAVVQALPQVKAEKEEATEETLIQLTDLLLPLTLDQVVVVETLVVMVAQEL
jgi:hypothetical protein